MDQDIVKARNNFIQGLSRISGFWGFSKAMGAIYGVIYLSPDPVGLNMIVEQVGITKGAVSTNVRSLERLGMIHKHLKVGDRKDYYTAETDFWKIAKGILKEREKNEFDLALKSVGQSLEMIQNKTFQKDDDVTAAFYNERFTAMNRFFDSLDKIIGVVLAWDSIRPDTILKLLKKKLK